MAVWRTLTALSEGSLESSWARKRGTEGRQEDEAILERKGRWKSLTVVESRAFSAAGNRTSAAQWRAGRVRRVAKKILEHKTH